MRHACLISYKDTITYPRVGTYAMPQVEASAYLDVDLAQKISEAANKRDQSISAFLRESARRELQRMEAQE